MYNKINQNKKMRVKADKLSEALHLIKETRHIINQAILEADKVRKDLQRAEEAFYSAIEETEDE